MGGSYESQEQIVIPNNGQDYLTASQEYCETFMESTCRRPAVACTATPTYPARWKLKNITTSYREQGKIDENTYAFYLTVVFVQKTSEH